MLGYLAIGVGLLLFYLDAMRALIRRYGNLGRALGLQWLFGGRIDPGHPKTVVASTMVVIVNSVGTLEIGRAHVCTPVTNAHLVCRLLLEKTKEQIQNNIYNTHQIQDTYSTREI